MGTSGERRTDEPPQWFEGTILVVDDEEGIRSLATKTLERSGFAVLTAPDGHEAVRSFRENRDEIRAVVLDIARQTAHVMGQSGATIRRDGEKHVFVSGQTFDLNVLGEVKIPKLDEGLPTEVVKAALSAESLPSNIAALIEEREIARRERDWAQSDALREQLADQGYLVEDTPQGPRWRRVAIS